MAAVKATDVKLGSQCVHKYLGLYGLCERCQHVLSVGHAHQSVLPGIQLHPVAATVKRAGAHGIAVHKWHKSASVTASHGT
jgi:hypothetical protein